VATPAPDRIRIGFPAPSVLSRQDWVAERAAEALPVITQVLLEEARGHDPLLVFLAGSGVHGELCGIVDPTGARRFLSDLDVGLLTERRIPRDLRERIAARLVRSSAEGPQPRVGYFCREDRGKQSPTLGLVEAARCGYVLSGDPGLFAALEMPLPRQIPAWEGRRLLCNRAIEWLSDSRPEKGRLSGVYAAAKLHADAAAVILLARGIYSGGGYDTRTRALGGIDLDAGLRSRIEAWTRWRLLPSWSGVPGGGSLDELAGSEALRLDLVETLRKTMQEAAGSDSAGRFLNGSPARGRAWGRAWKRWLALHPRALLGLRPGALRRTPRVLLWEATLHFLLGRDEDAAAVMGRLLGTRATTRLASATFISGIGRAMDREGVDG